MHDEIFAKLSGRHYIKFGSHYIFIELLKLQPRLVNAVTTQRGSPRGYRPMLHAAVGTEPHQIGANSMTIVNI
jgi:hypothetical protein